MGNFYLANLENELGSSWWFVEHDPAKKDYWGKVMEVEGVYVETREDLVLCKDMPQLQNWIGKSRKQERAVGRSGNKEKHFGVFFSQARCNKAYFDYIGGFGGMAAYLPGFEPNGEFIAGRSLGWEWKERADPEDLQRILMHQEQLRQQPVGQDEFYYLMYPEHKDQRERSKEFWNRVVEADPSSRPYLDHPFFLRGFLEAVVANAGRQ